ncbi:rCG45263 [Rattus norvegicus]|uniref:RCG45263 n=1 Tax=Rattus norvegicus TaxID=10116 RepID=A6KLQ6_RAT|nr:rCG45263 [Rattus norvegicus]
MTGDGYRDPCLESRHLKWLKAESRQSSYQEAEWHYRCC